MIGLWSLRALNLKLYHNEAVLNEKGVGILTITSTLILGDSSFEAFCCTCFVGGFHIEQNYDRFLYFLACTTPTPRSSFCSYLLRSVLLILTHTGARTHTHTFRTFVIMGQSYCNSMVENCFLPGNNTNLARRRIWPLKIGSKRRKFMSSKVLSFTSQLLFLNGRSTPLTKFYDKF